MNHKNDLSKNHRELKIEATLKATLFGLSAGLLVGVIVFFVGIVTTQNLLWLGLGISGLIAILTGFFIYWVPERPTVMKVAKRIDQMGLEERTITMVELDEEETYIAKVQREDTKTALAAFRPKLLVFSSFFRPLLMFSIALVLMITSLTFMMTIVNAADDDPSDSPTDISAEDAMFQEMIDELLSIINQANIDVTLKSTLYTMVVDLERRLPTYETYMEKYADVLKTRNEILQMIADAILELEESLMNIAEALQQYENTEILGLALATWDDDEIIAAFDYMYDRIDVLLGQELYDVMWQTAIDIETALAESVGTYPPMAEALQALADAYKLALDAYEPGNEDEVLADAKAGMDQSLEDLLAAIQELRDMIEELEELEEEIEEETDEFPMFMPFPEDSAEGSDPGDPNTNSENTVIDGQTPYEDVYDTYYEDAMAWLAGENISEDMRRIIENYFNMLS
ncbi:MAG: hypothetical protein K9K93_01815 [Acholeplasmataceae bacterium]|nr:hypothetical protein [Acholeplasmataceae bacterium]